MKWLALKTIRLYQKTFSLDHGPFKHLFPRGFCRFYPSCSEYGHECIAHHGLLKGGFLTAWRIVRCNPFSPGGIDEPPPLYSKPLFRRRRIRLRRKWRSLTGLKAL